MGPIQREVILHSLVPKVSVVNFPKCLHTSANARGYYDPSDSCKALYRFKFITLSF